MASAPTSISEIFLIYHWANPSWCQLEVDLNNLKSVTGEVFIMHSLGKKRKDGTELGDEREKKKTVFVIASHNKWLCTVVYFRGAIYLCPVFYFGLQRERNKQMFKHRICICGRTQSYRNTETRDRVKTVYSYSSCHWSFSKITRKIQK